MPSKRTTVYSKLIEVSGKTSSNSSGSWTAFLRVGWGVEVQLQNSSVVSVSGFLFTLEPLTTSWRQGAVVSYYVHVLAWSGCGP